MKTAGVTNYTNQTPVVSVLNRKKVSKFNPPPHPNEKTFVKCAQKSRCTSSMCEQSL